MHRAIQLLHAIGEGKDRETQVLLADDWRKLVLIQLRRGALLDDHSARVPITIQVVAGCGELRVDEETYALSPGMIVPVDPHVIHRVQGGPDLAILVTFFRQSGLGAESETTARFD